MIDETRKERSATGPRDDLPRWMPQRLAQVAALLQEGEAVGVPVRNGDRIVLPVLPAGARPEAIAHDEESIQALVSALLE